MLSAPPTIFRRFVQYLCRPQVQIHGRNSSWSKALAPRSPVWNGLGEFSLALSHRWGLLPSWRRRFVIPLFERDVATMPLPCWALVPTPEALARLADKALFERYARLHGLSAFVPATFDPRAAAMFPAVLKLTNRSAGEGIVVVKSAAELTAQLASERFAGHSVLLQELIDADIDYVTHLVAVEGRILWHVTYSYALASTLIMRNRKNFLSIGPSSVSPEDIDLFEHFLRPLRFNGPANIDFRRRADGSIVILEINPRFGGSLMRPGYVADLRASVGAILAHATLHR